MLPKVKYKNYNEIIKNMQQKICKYTNDIWIPSDKIKMKKVNTNSWFSLSESFENKECDFIEHNYNTENLVIPTYKAKKITLILNQTQKNIINNWLNIYALMYNSSIKYIKNNVENDKNVLKFINLRKILKNEKKELIKNSNIKVHDIDGAIKLACTMYRSALTNIKNCNIKKFRIRYWKKKKEIKIMDLEKQNFTKYGIRTNILGKIIGKYNGENFNFNDIKCDCKLQKRNENYYLFVPEKIKTIQAEKPNKIISIDPGIRTFFTGITESKVIKIKDKKSIIKGYLKRKDKIMKNELISDKIKKKNEKMINKKISNIVSDLHWKTIKYLTDNNEVILMGNMSTKNISKKEGNLNSMTKRIGLMMRLYEFKQRLRFKCGINGTKFGEIDEWYTSKMCSKCGNIKDDLKGDKVYDCLKCKTKMDRDINGSRNIYMVAINK